VLSGPWLFGTALVLLACGCGAGGAHLPAPRVDLGRQLLVLTAADGEVCAASTSASPVCLPVVASSEPVVSAALARLDASADLVMVLARPDVVVRGLGEGTARATVRPGGRELQVWLAAVPAATGPVCASYRAPEEDGRFVVHATSIVTSAETVAVAVEPDDGC
jgi:hypothetical protein